MDDDGQIHRPEQDIGHTSAPQDHEDSSSSFPPLVPPPQPVQNADLSFSQLNTINPPYQAISPPKTAGQRTSTLTEVKPDSASITGGVRIFGFPTGNDESTVPRYGSTAVEVGG